jgi:sorbitol/mannitol transport system substrate-binding protein
MTVGMTQDTTITIATVNNGDMIRMQGYTDQFTAETGIAVEWVTLEENVLRQRVTTDITTNGGQFDIMTIGMYEAPIWGANGWLVPLDNLSEEYNVDDILPAMRAGLSNEGTLYAAPFYGESSMVMYRTDLMEAAGLEMPTAPTWDDIREAAAAMDDPENGVNGICLRGKPGWGEGGAFINVTANSFGARVVDEDWQAQLDSEEWANALNFFVNLMNDFGPDGYATNGFNENLSLFQQGLCGMWIDATVAASFVTNPNDSKSRTRSASPLPPTPVLARVRTGSGPGHWRSPPVRSNPTPRFSSSSGRPRPTISSWSPRTKAGPTCPRVRASRSTRTPTTPRFRSRR